MTDKKILGINQRMDRLISLQLHHYGALKICGENAIDKYCYSAEYEPQLNFISNDYREMDILYQRIL